MGKPIRLLCDVGVLAILAGAVLSVYLTEKKFTPSESEPTQSDLAVSVQEERLVTEVVSEPPRIAVTTPRFDDMGKLLESLGNGYRFETVSLTELVHPDRLAEFDVVFLTCTEPNAVPPTLSHKLRDFVASGGTLYASDLLFDVVGQAFPEFVDETSIAQGTAQAVVAEVVDAGLQNSVGAEMELHFDLDGWRPAAFRPDITTVYLRGTFRTTAGVDITAPLLVTFPVENGTVVFTSFHNEQQASEEELHLLRHLVFTTVTAIVESKVRRTMVTGGFSPSKESLLSTSPETPTITQTYDNQEPGSLQFALGFGKQGAELHLQVRGPAGQTYEKRGDSTFAIEVPNAPAGKWAYTVTAHKIPYANFPFSLTVGSVSTGEITVADDTVAKKSGTSQPQTGTAPGMEAPTSIRFLEVQLEEESPQQAMRLAVTPPRYDDMGKLLQTLGEGYKFDLISEADLADSDVLSEYDVLFLTCNSGTPTSVVNASLQSFAEGGGTIYASDLRYDMIASAFPEFVRTKEDPESLEDKQKSVIAEALEAAGFDSNALVEEPVESIEEALRGASLGPTAIQRVTTIAQALSAKGVADTPRQSAYTIKKVLREAGITGIEETDIEMIKETLRVRGLKINRMKYDARKQREQVQKNARVQQVIQQALRQLAAKLAQENIAGIAQLLDAEVVDPGLSELLGSTMKLHFDLGSWKPANFGGKHVTVFLRGEYQAMDGQIREAPFLVRFPAGDGTVIFTSFHNERQNNEDELKLLRYLVFRAVIAKTESVVTKTMVSGGFSPVKNDVHSHSSGSPSMTQVYRNKRPGRLQFALGFANQGARLKLTIVAPNGQRHEKIAESTFIVEVPDAPIGNWQYTVTAEQVPFPNFPFMVNVGEEQPSR